MRLTDAQRLDWLRLIRRENIGPRTFRGSQSLWRRGRCARRLARSHSRPWRARGRSGSHLRHEDCRREIERPTARPHGCCARRFGRARLSAPARDRRGTAPRRSARQCPDALTRPMIAIVGSRNASAAGRHSRTGSRRILAAQDYVIVSGLARGIDHQAHRRACRPARLPCLLAG